jgi:hypothetical protein
MGGYEPRDSERENVAYGPWAAWRNPDDPGSDRSLGAEHRAAVSSANAMDCENAPAPSFVRTESPASRLEDHAPAPPAATACPDGESDRDNLFLEGHPERQPVRSAEGSPPAGDDPARGNGVEAPLGGSSWSAAAAAHRDDIARFTRAPDSLARRLLSTRPAQVSPRRALSGVVAVVAIAATALIAFVGAPGWLPLVGSSGSGSHTLSLHALTGNRPAAFTPRHTTTLYPTLRNIRLAVKHSKPSRGPRRPVHRPAHGTVVVAHHTASSSRYVASQSPSTSSSSEPSASGSSSTPPATSSESSTPATTQPTVAPSTHSGPSTSSSQTASAKPKQTGPTGPVSLIGAGTSPSS